LDNRKEDAGNGDRSYSSAGHHKRRKNIFMIGIPILGAVIVLGIVFSIQASGQGDMGNKMVMHIHPQITVSVNGQPIIVPENVGIDNTIWKDHSLDKYGMQGMSPLHTHDNSGTLHVESTVNRDYTLGELVNVWGGLDTSNGKILKVTVNGQPISDWKNHILKDKEKISFEISQQ
jgi:sulfur carrier protein ThiS